MHIEQEINDTYSLKLQYQCDSSNNLSERNQECSYCNYSTTVEMDLQRHIIEHQTDKIARYKCPECALQTERESDLNDHVKIHKNVLDSVLCSCRICTFKTKSKFILEIHALLHNKTTTGSSENQISETNDINIVQENLDETIMYRCNTCQFQTKHKRYLPHHMLTHRNPNEIEMFKCDICDYQTKTRSRLKRHLIIHKDPNEVKMFKCSICVYQTKHKNGLRKHEIIHKDPIEIMMYKCQICSFQTKYKDSFSSSRSNE